MNPNTTEREVLRKFVDQVLPAGRAIVEIYRARPEGGWYDPEQRLLYNQVLAAGLNELATKFTVTSRPAYGWIAVGTQTAAASLGSTWGGEVSRKAGATLTTSKMTAILVSTWGGAADRVTSVALETATIVNHVNSGSGIPFNILTGVSATLANSDLLKLQMEAKIGSHNL